MPDEGDDAPDFTAPFVEDEIGEASLSDRLEEDAPVVLAFFPGAFTPPCREEMAQFQADIDRYRDLGATLYGVSVDTPFAQQEFREREGFEFGMVSDTNKRIVDDYDVRIDMADIGYYGLSNRAVFVVDADGEITYKWVADDPETQPDFDAVADAVEAA